MITSLTSYFLAAVPAAATIVLYKRRSQYKRKEKLETETRLESKRKAVEAVEAAAAAEVKKAVEAAVKEAMNNADLMRSNNLALLKRVRENKQRILHEELRLADERLRESIRSVNKAFGA